MILKTTSQTAPARETLRTRIRLATAADRPAIYRLRHTVFAEELGQHEHNAACELRDALDDYNVYLVAEVDGVLAGIVSVTPPPERTGDKQHTYSVDKYLSRYRLPFAFDGGLFEVRLLSVTEPFRGSPIAGLLMHGALRWIENQGGTHMMVMGRDALVDLYERVGLKPVPVQIRSGAVTYQVMHANMAQLHEARETYQSALGRLASRVDWDLEAPMIPEAPACYHGGAFFNAIGDGFEDLDRRRSVINADVLDAWFDPSDAVIGTLRQHLPWLIKTSPPTDCGGLVRAIARHRGIDPEHIVVGGGSSDLIYLALNQWLTAESRVLILDPMYGEYAHVLERVIGCDVDRLPLRRENGYRMDPAELAGALARGYDAAILVNPNSPTGRYAPNIGLKEVLAGAPRTTKLWVDETYIDYVDSAESLEGFATRSANLVVCKSMSKVYALSGARAAYLCGPRAMVDPLKPLSPPWAVGLPGQVAAVKALESENYYRACWAQTHQLREAMALDLAERCGLEVIPGVANFLLTHLPEDGPTSAQVVAKCRERGLYLRDAGGMGKGLGEHALRLAVKARPVNRQIVDILANVLEEISP